MLLGRSVSLRGLLAAILALAVIAGGACALFAGSRDEAAHARAGEAEVRRVAGLISDRLGEELATIGRDVNLAAENAVLGRDGNAAARPFLERWRAMRPGYADVLVADRNGRVLVTASGAAAGADVSGTTWFARGLTGTVIGDASERARAGTEVARNVIVAAPVRVGGTAATGVLAVQLAPDWIEDAIAATRRSLGGSARDAVVQVMNAGGRALHRSAGPAGEGAVHEASAPVGDGMGLGWVVSVKGRGRIEDGAQNGPAALLALGAAALAAAFVGAALGGRLGRDVARIRVAARGDQADPVRTGAATADLAALAEAVGGCVGRSQGRERLLKESRAALARSRDRVRAVRLLGGFTCWEVDLRNGQVTWADGAAGTAESATERACDLEEVLARVEPGDRDQLKRTMRAVCEEPGAVREVVIHTQAGPEDAAGRRLVLRLTAVALDGHPVRLHILSRELALAALPAPTTLPAVASAPEPQGGFPAQAIVAGLAQDIGGALNAIVAALEDVVGEAGAARDHRIEAAQRDAARGVALLRRVTTLVRPEEAPAQGTDADGVVAETAAFIRAAILPGLVVSRPAGVLPRPACGARELEVALLNLASDARDSLPADTVVTLTLGRAEAPSGQGPAGLRVELSAPAGFRAGRGLAAIRDLVDGLDGSVSVEAVGGGVRVALMLPAAPDGDAGSGAVARTVLLVEPDAVLRAATAEILTGRGYAVTSTASADQAREALAARRDFTVFLCAHAMPELDGVHLARVVARTHPAVAVVLMTAEAVPARGGATHRTLCKPFSSGDLLEAIEALGTQHGRINAA